MKTPILGITAYSGTGKTTLLKKLIPTLLEYDVRVSVIKHAHHHFDVDTPGKDSYEIRKAGAQQTLVASNKRWALMTETADQETLNLEYLIDQLDTHRIDLVIVEGFKALDIPKIILHREATGKGLPETSPETLAIASDNGSLQTSLPILDINNIQSITQFICQHFELPLKNSIHN